MNKINVTEAFDTIQRYFSPKVIGSVNDVYAKIAKIKGDEIPWHAHENEDELFFIVEGKLLMEIEGRVSFEMHEGDMFVVPKGVVHRVSSINECRVLLIEPKGTAHTGEVESSVTKSIGEQFY